MWSRLARLTPATPALRLSPRDSTLGLLQRQCLLLVGVLLGFKGHKALLLAGEKLLTLESLLTLVWIGLLEMLAVLGICGLVMNVCLLIRPLWLRRLTQALWGLLFAFGILAALVEHRFFLSTGSLLTRAQVKHGIEQARDVAGLIVAEVPPVWWAACLLPLTLAIWAMVSGWRARKPGWAPSWQARSLTLLCSLGTLLAQVSAAQPDPTQIWVSPLAPLTPNLFIAMLADELRSHGLLVRAEPLYLALREALPEARALEVLPEHAPLNVLLVVLESVRADIVGAYNPTLDSTPFLDRLAREGLRVERAYSLMPHTTKSLVPLICGYPPDIRPDLSETSPSALPVDCLPKLLSQVGYRSAFFQPARGRFENRPALAQNLGYQTFVGAEQLERKGWQSPNYFGLEDRALIKPVLAWVDSGSEPFFLTLLTLITHHDYKVPTGFERRHYPGPYRYSDYVNALRYSDQLLKDLFEGLEQRGLTQNTLILVIGDHGEAHGEHGKLGHDQVLTDEGLRVPWILWNPSRIPAPGVVQGARQNLDLAPTVLELLGLRLKQGSFAGRPLSQSVDDRTLFASCWLEHRCLAWLKGHEKTLFHFGWRSIEVFDLEKDPAEKENLAETVSEDVLRLRVEAMMAWRKELRGIYARHREQVGAGYIFLERPSPSHPVDLTFDRRFTAFGYDLDGVDATGKAQQGSELAISVYFELTQFLGNRRSFKLSLLDANGQEFPLHFSSSEAQFPMYAWVPGQYHKLKLLFEVPQAAAPGPASLRLFGLKNKKDIMGVMGADADLWGGYGQIPLTLR